MAPLLGLSIYLATMGFKSSNDLEFGMAVINSHGKERCHIDSIVDTTKLAIAYALDL